MLPVPGFQAQVGARIVPWKPSKHSQLPCKPWALQWCPAWQQIAWLAQLPTGMAKHPWSVANSLFGNTPAKCNCLEQLHVKLPHGTSARGAVTLLKWAAHIWNRADCWGSFSLKAQLASIKCLTDRLALPHHFFGGILQNHHINSPSLALDTL